MNKWTFLFIMFHGVLAFSSSDNSEKILVQEKREVSFDEILVQGKHHFSDEAIDTISKDKVLDTLLEVPKDFTDRIKRSSQRN